MSDDFVLRYGHASNKSVFQARQNFTEAGFDILSLCCTPVEILCVGETLERITHASGFFWKKDGAPYLVTNWHVASGRNPFTRQFLGKITPHRIRCFGRSLRLDNGVLNFSDRPIIIEWEEEMIELLSSPPIVDGEEVDICAFPVLPDSVFGQNSVPDHEEANRATCFLNEATGNVRIKTGAGDECYILGYPLDTYQGLHLPIWKRGSISSDTNIGVMGKPMFLVDAATTDAMSGSPIVRRVKFSTSLDSSTGVIAESHANQLVGVYAGRLLSKQLERINIGYGWYASMIDKVIDYYHSRKA